MPVAHRLQSPAAADTAEYMLWARCYPPLPPGPRLTLASGDVEYHRRTQDPAKIERTEKEIREIISPEPTIQKLRTSAPIVSFWLVKLSQSQLEQIRQLKGVGFFLVHF